MVNASRMAKVKAIAPEMKSIRDRFVGVAAPPRFSLRDELKVLLKSRDLVKTRRVNPTRMAVNLKNRFGQGVVPARPHTLLSDIVGEGFSLQELDDPWGVEAPDVMSKEYEEMFEWNQSICRTSGDLLPEYTEEVEGTSLTCTNTNQSLRVVLQGAPSSHKLLSEDGHLSLALLERRDALYAQHCRDGLIWNFIPSEVESEHPWVSELFQEAGNTKQAASFLFLFFLCEYK